MHERPDEKIDVSQQALEMLDNMSQSRMEILQIRTMRRLVGMGYPEDSEVDQEVFSEAFVEEVKAMLITDTMKKLSQAGMVEACGTNENGELVYRATEKGLKEAQRSRETL